MFIQQTAPIHLAFQFSQKSYVFLQLWSFGSLSLCLPGVPPFETMVEQQGRNTLCHSLVLILSALDTITHGLQQKSVE